MTIDELYSLLCDLYGVTTRLPIERYLTLVEERADCAIGNRLPHREALFIRQPGDGIELGLFIDPGVIAHLAEGDALDRLDDLACATEGVSHFLAVVERIHEGRPISALELELQGEVDKFLVIHLLAARRDGAVDPQLFRRLFEHHDFLPQLSAAERERYETADHLAAKYCAWLRDRFFNPLRLSELVNHARDFFRRGLAEKVALLVP